MISFENYWTTNFNQLRIKALDKRQVVNEDLSSLINNLPSSIIVECVGESFLGAPIRKLVVGSGAKKVIAWAAMHGNESTSLRGWMDLFVNQDNEEVSAYFLDIFSKFQLHFIPLLNPDGAMEYARRNAMGLDMNRDARALQTPEMQCLLAQIDEIKPVIAFNLHDQRNIFAVNNLPATISFLAPSEDIARSITPLRAKTMDLIGAAFKAIEPVISGGIGRYTDEFYPTAIGERVQEMGIPTVLVECGASVNDPMRQEARMMNAIILHAALTRFSQDAVPETEVYQNIPLNQTNQVDFLIRNTEVNFDGKSFKADVAIMEEIKFNNRKQVSVYRISDLGDLRHVVGLQEFVFKNTPKVFHGRVGELADFSFITHEGELKFEKGELI